MRLLPSALFALAIVACELVDPLDDISGGERDAGTTSSSSSSGSASSSSSSGGAVSADSGGANGDASAGLVPTCSGTHETEPNDGNPNQLPFGESCGVLTNGSSDVDSWIYTNNTGSSLSFTLLVDAPSEVYIVVRAGTSQVSENAGSAFDSSLAAGERLLLAITSTSNADVAYTVHFTRR